MNGDRGVRWYAELMGHLAVVLSLIYVGVQVKQNTVAVQAETSQTIYDYHREFAQLTVENADVADLLLRANRDPGSLSPVDSLRLDSHLNLRVNLYESVYASATLGAMEMEMAESWLRGMPRLGCEDLFRAYWREYSLEYTEEFAAAMDSVQAEFCP